MTTAYRHLLALLAWAGLFVVALIAVGLAWDDFGKGGGSFFGDNPASADEHKAVVERGDGDWPLFRGNALQTGVTAAALPDKLVELWTFPTKDSVEAAVAVANGVVYLGSMDEHLYALDLEKGAEKWKYKGGPFKAPPSVHDRFVYAGDADGLFHCVDAAKGTKRWTFETGAEIDSGANFAPESVLFGSTDETLYCLNLEGKERWKFKISGPIYGSPAVADGRTFVAGCDSNVHVLDVAKGSELLAVELSGQTGATPAVAGDRIFVGTMSNDVQAVDWKKGEVAWTFRPKKALAFRSSAAVTDALVVIGSQDRRVYALKRDDGKEAWNFATGGRVDASPVVAGGRVYAGSLDGKLYVLDLKTGQQVQKIALDGPISASPAVAGGRLLIGTQKGTLYCFGAK
jgi:outer membrane protein assembly factor BamB